MAIRYRLVFIRKTATLNIIKRYVRRSLHFELPFVYIYLLFDYIIVVVIIVIVVVDIIVIIILLLFNIVTSELLTGT